jgi:transposase
MRFYLGLDVHSNTSTYCLLDERGVELETRTVRGGWDKLLTRLREIRDPRPGADLRVCYEASLGYGALHDRLAALGARVVVAHPGRLRLIFRSKRKNDRVDAKKLATLLLLDQVPAVHVPLPGVRAWRELIEFRRVLIDKRTRCKNSLRALLRGLGVQAPGSPWSARGRAVLAALALPTPRAALKRDLLVAELVHLEAQVKKVTAELDRLAALHPGVALLRTVPGVGPRTAEAFLAYVDDPRRFAKARRLGAYLGLAPCQDASAGVNRLGHITKEGPATLRKLLVEAAWRCVDRDASMREFFERVAAGKPDRRKVALVAVAHKLARVMLAMLRSGEAYAPPEPPRREPAAEKAAA